MGAHIPITANIGFGYPLNLLAGSLHLQLTLQINTVFFSILPIGITLACIGFAGAFHTMKMLAWGEGVAVTSTFFRGIKNNILQFIFTGLLVSFGIFTVVFNFGVYNMSGKGFWDVMSVIATTVLLIFLLFFALFMFTQTVTYKIKFLGLLRNSFLFSIGVIFQNAIFIGITILPIYLTMSLSGIFGMIFIMLYMFIGISLTILIWTLYAHWVFDRFLNEKVEGAIKDRGIYRKNKEEIAAKREDERKRQEKARYVNPKKKTKKSISEGKSYTPLESTFSRADLEKLNKEKQEVKKELDEEDSE